MKLKTKILKTIRTPRTKSISTHKNLPPTSTHYDGSILINIDSTFINSSFASTNPASNKLAITTCPVRASCFYKNSLLLGNDFGEITVHDSTGVKIRTIKAHNDFVRGLSSNDDVFVSCSDDLSVKVFKDYRAVFVFNHEHFVMGVVVSGNRIYSVSLDCTAKVFEIGYRNDSDVNNPDSNSPNSDINSEISVACIATLKDHKMGINNLDVFKNYLATCGDDLKVNIYEIESLKLVNTIVTEKNVLSLCFCDRFLFCGGEDGIVLVYELKTLSLVGVLRPNLGRVWAISSHEPTNKFMNNNNITVYLGCDEGIQSVELCRPSTLTTMIRNKIIVISNGTISKLSMRDGKVISRELKVSDCFDDVVDICSNSKFVAVEKDGIIEVYNYIGFRHKETIEGRSLCFVNDHNANEHHANNSPVNNNSDIYDGNLSYAYLKNDFVCYRDLKLEIPGIKRLYSIKDGIFAGVTESETIVFDINTDANSSEIIKLPVFTRIVFQKNFLFCFSDKINVYDDKFNIVSVFNHRADHVFVYDDLIFFMKNDHLFYIVSGQRPYLQFVRIETNYLLGVIDDIVVYKKVGADADQITDNASDKELFATYALDVAFINYQREVLNGNFPPFEIDYKAIQFLQSLGYYEQILDAVSDKDVKFDILVKIKRYDEAMAVAHKTNQLLCLADVYKESGDYKKASLMFYQGGRYDDSFLMYCCSGGDFKKNSDDGRSDTDEFLKNELPGKISGILKLIVDYKNGEFESCAESLKNTDFHELFLKHHFAQK